MVATGAVWRVEILLGLFGSLAAPEDGLPDLTEIWIDVLFWIPCVTATDPVHYNRLVVVLRDHLILHWTDISQIHQVLIIWLNFPLQTQVPELILDLILLILLVN